MCAVIRDLDMRTNKVIRKNRGFTLVELLVVIAIIALLLSVLIPGLQAARKQARKVVCASNLQQISMGMGLYAADFGDKAMVLREKNNDLGYWFTKLAPYMGDKNYVKDPQRRKEGAMKVSYCPEAQKLPAGTSQQLQGDATHAWRWHYGTGAEGSYGINSWVVWDPLYPNYDKNNYYTMFNQLGSDVPLAGDCVWANGWPQDTDAAPWDVSVGAPFESASHIGRFCINRHNMAVNISFSGGTVKLVKLRDLWSLRWHRNFKKKYNVVVPRPRIGP